MRGALELSVGPGEDGRGDERREVASAVERTEEKGEEKGGGSY